ncbi:MAG: hypothetical protein RLY56_313 [Pseudomonadota bacterium]|jgi:nicotinamide mononucleotide transporter
MLATHWAEQVALICGVVYAVLAVKRIRWAWVFGAGSSALLVWLAAGADLPLQAVLQAVYVLMAFYGFWHWSKVAPGEKVVSVKMWTWRRHLVAWLVIALLVWFGAPLLQQHTAAAWPHLDVAVTGLSLLATWMTARAILENWGYWLLVDALSFYMYSSQGLLFVAMLYLIYFVIAIFGLRSWWRQRA